MDVLKYFFFLPRMLFYLFQQATQIAVNRFFCPFRAPLFNSYKIVGSAELAASCAMPVPIVPAPQMQILFIMFKVRM